MANTSLQRRSPEVAAVVAALEAARGRPHDIALRDAVEIGSELSPLVIAVVEKAARGVYLLPKQQNLLFWGIHALAAARCTALCQPLLRLLRQCDEDELDRLLGDATTETLKQVVIAIFDGNAELLIEACADPAVDSYARWNLILALARLTFDGAIPRESTMAFLDRFEREPLADSDDPAWEGWAEAISLLGLEDMRGRLRAAFQDGRLDDTISGLEHFEQQLTLACSLAPGDPALFVQWRIDPLGDPAKALSWIKTDQELRTAKELEDDGRLDDPAAIVALDDEEASWLEGFLGSGHVKGDTLAMENLEQIDGFFCALIAGPPGAALDQYAAAIWSEDGSSGIEPDYDSPEQAVFVESLLKRHWNTISLRLSADRTHDLILPERPYEPAGRDWAGGFIRGVALRSAEWATRRKEEDIAAVLGGIVALGVDPVSYPKQAVKARERSSVIAALPRAVLLMHCHWRGRPFPYSRQSSAIGGADFGRKVGRNEPCPCGSGQKYKRCCGSPDRRVN